MIDCEEAFVRGFMKGIDARVPEGFKIPLERYHFSYPESYFKLEDAFKEINEYHQKKIAKEVKKDSGIALFDPEAHNLAKFMPPDTRTNFHKRRDFLTGFFSAIVVRRFFEAQKNKPKKEG